MKQLIHRLMLKSYISILRDGDLSYKNSTILAGLPRSGTTWITDCINYNNQYRYVFEPFNRLSLTKGYEDYLMLKDKYLDPDILYAEQYKMAEQVLSGKLKHEAIDFKSFNNNKMKIYFHKRVIKMISANLLLKWLYVSFPNLPIIFLLRHPCAIALSRTNFDWQNF